MAERGCSLDEVVSTAEQVARSVGVCVCVCVCVLMVCGCELVIWCAGTASVSLSPCSVPGHKPSFTLEEDEMELGLGEIAMHTLL
jgi:dihydroxyacetone kinase